MDEVLARRLAQGDTEAELQIFNARLESMVKTEQNEEGFCEISLDQKNQPLKLSNSSVDDVFEVIEDTGDQALIAYYNESPAYASSVPIIDKVKQRITNLGFITSSNGSREVNLNNATKMPQQRAEAYIFAEKFFQHDSVDFQERFRQLLWITYCRQFKPLLIEIDSWLGRPVANLKTDNSWGCTIRCLQMLLANAFLASPELEIPARIVKADVQQKNRPIDILTLFNNDKRASVAPYSIQNVAEVGLKEFGVYPG